jgi:hypothetical protein
MCHIKLPVYYSFHLDERWRHRAMVKVAKTLRTLGDHLQVGASVRNVYGDPVNIGGRTVIPIARVSYGFGAGGRVGGNGDAESERGGSGGGAGMTARPVGHGTYRRIPDRPHHQSRTRAAAIRYPQNLGKPWPG